MVNLKLELDREDRAAEHEPGAMNQVKIFYAVPFARLRG